MEQLAQKSAVSSDETARTLPQELLELYDVGPETGRGPLSRRFDAVSKQTGLAGTLKLLVAATPGGPAHSEPAYSEAEKQRIKREWAKQSALVESDRLLVPRAWGDVRGTLWLFRAKAEGVPLDVILKDGPLSLEDGLPVVAAIADALDELHGAGLLHRDLRPEHILLGPGEAAQGDASITILDAGLAPAIETGTAFDVFGTPGYVSPEQITGKLHSFRSDLYSLGCVFYEILTGHRLFERSTSKALLEAHASAPRPALPAEFPEALRQLLASLVSIDAKERPVAAREVAAAVRAIFASLAQNSVSPPAVNAVKEEAPVSKADLNLGAIQDAIAKSSLLGIAGTPANTHAHAASPPRPLTDAVVAPQRPAPITDAFAPTMELPRINARGYQSVVPTMQMPTPFKAAPSFSPDDRMGAAVPAPRQNLTAPQGFAINSRGYSSVAPDGAPPPLPGVGPRQTIAFESPAPHHDAEEIHADDVEEIEPSIRFAAQAQMDHGIELTPTPILIRTPSQAAIHSSGYVGRDTAIDDMRIEPFVIPTGAVPANLPAPVRDERRGFSVAMVVAISLITCLLGAAIMGGMFFIFRSLTAPKVESVATAPVTVQVPTPTAPAEVVPTAAAAPVAAVPAVAAPTLVAPAEAAPIAAAAEVAAAPVAEAAAAEAAAPEATEVIAAEPVAAAATKPAKVSARAKAASRREAAREAKAERLAAARAKAAEQAAARQAKASQARAAKEAKKAEQALAATAAAPVAAAPASSGSAFDAIREEGKAHFAARRFGDAAASYGKAAQMNPSHAGAWAGLGASQLALGDASAAVDAYMKAVTIAPTHSGYFAALGRAYAQSGDRDAAIQAYERSLALNPENGAAQKALTELGAR